MAPAATDAARTTAGNGSAASSGRPAPPCGGIARPTSCRARRGVYGGPTGANPLDEGVETPLDRGLDRSPSAQTAIGSARGRCGRHGCPSLPRWPRLQVVVVRLPAFVPVLVAVLSVGAVVIVGADALGIDRPAASAAAPTAAAETRAAPVARGRPPHDDAPPLLGIATGEEAGHIAYPDGPALPALPGEIRSVEVMVRNDGNELWQATGANPVMLSYHLYDASGHLIAWDGLRTTLPFDISPGYDGALALRVALPARTGTYSIKPDLIRDGRAWFSSLGTPQSAFPLRVTSDLDATYGATTAPASIVPGGEVNVEVRVKNTGLRAWPAGGDHPVHLGYHWFDMGSNAVVWDGARTALPHDVAPGEEVAFTVDMRAPQGEGAYALAWDMVQEGTAWFSRVAVPMKEDTVVVERGVTFYGKGWGHGIGLSQWGAQGWAEGATGVTLSGEQIVAKYFPGAQLATQPIAAPFRVLLSAPSTGCVGRTIDDVAHMRSEGGMRLVSNADPGVVYVETAPDEPVRFEASGTTLVAVDEWSGQIVFSGDATRLRLTPKQWWDPIGIAEKGLWYRGSMTVEVRDGAQLRVVNEVSSDDYMMGALPGEMPSQWQMEALRAQAITARTYAAWRQATAGDRTWDVRDDTADQCYGGDGFESTRTTAAVDSPAGLILTYDGKPIRALYSSASRGITENVGCLLDAERVGDTWQWAQGWPYSQVTPDPAETAADDTRCGKTQ